jgi:hypothetical protein
MQPVMPRPAVSSTAWSKPEKKIVRESAAQHGAAADTGCRRREPAGETHRVHPKFFAS